MGNDMLFISIKAITYLILFILAFACVQTANTIKGDTCDCKVINLIFIIIGTFTFSCALFYMFNLTWMLISLLPLIFGFTLNLLMSHTYTHDIVNKLLKTIKTKFIALLASD